MQTPRQRPNIYTRLQFADAAGCVAWLESLPLSDAAATHEVVSAQVEILERSAGLRALERLRILEVLQRPIATLQQDFASRYAGKPLPLSIMDYAVWNSVIELWQTLFGAYHDLLNAAGDGEPTLQRHAPLLALRCLESSGASMREHQRAYRAIPAGLWMQLHKVFARAERSGFVGRSLDDPVGTAGATRSCTAAYAQAVLAASADPYALSARQMDFTYRWLALWGPLARVVHELPPDAAATTLAVDLASRSGAVAAEAAPVTNTLRYLDLDQLSRSMRRTLTLLQQGRSPAELGLGDDCRQPGTEGLISLLHTTWFGGGLAGFPPRPAPGEPVEACIGFRAAHHQLAAGDTEPQDESDDRFATRTAPWNPTVEKWVLHDSGVNGMVRVARGPECEVRVQHRQLVGMRRSEHAPLQVGILQRIELGETGDLAMSVRVIPVAAQAVELRRIGGSVAAASSSLRAILLAGTQVPAAAPTLLLEPGHFHAGMRVEIVGAQPGSATLTQLVEQGVDFDRVAFAA